MSRFNETKANASRIEFYLLFGFFLFGSAGFFISLTSLEDNSQEMKIPETLSVERDAYLSKLEETEINQWNTYEVNDYEISGDTEIITSPRTQIKIYANSVIGLYFKERGNYEIIFRSKKEQKIIFREFISI
jgi:hypothetical protein